MRVVYADAETAGALQSEVDKAGLRSEIEVRCDPFLHPGVVVTVGGEAYSFLLVRDCYAGPRVLLGGSAGRI